MTALVNRLCNSRGKIANVLNWSSGVIRSLKLHIRLLTIFYRFSILTELEYRVNFLTNILMSFLWMGWGILSVTVFFNVRSRIGGWNYDEVLMVIGLYTMFTGVIEAFFRPNVSNIIEQIREGTFDFVLVKPVNAQFYASLRTIVVWRVFDIAAGLAIVAYALRQLGITPTPAQIGTFIVMVVLAAVIVYSLWLMMVTLAFWFIKVDNLTELFNAFYEAGRFPISVYQGWLRAVLTFVIPIAFITTFPAAVLLNRAGDVQLAWGVALAALLFFLSNRFWTWAIRSYSSASS
jgi:viologen exporter family transport system permease protein